MSIERWGWYSIGVNVVLAAINLVIAFASGSLAVEAEMIHNIVDLLAAVAVLVGLKLSTRKSKVSPYGLYKLENVVAVVLAGMIFFTAYEIAREAIFTPARQATVDLWMLGGVVVAAVIPLVFSHFELRAGRAANSPALIADAKEYRAHVFTTGIVFAAPVAQWFDLPLDRGAALIIVVAIGKTGWDLLANGMSGLMVCSELRTEIAEREQAQATIIEQQRTLAALEERERLGRELHDGLGQVIGYINMQAQTVETMLAAGQVMPARANLRRIVQTAQDAHADIRNFILGLRTEDAPRQDFWEALRDCLRQFHTTYGIETGLSLPDSASIPEFGPVVQDHLLHIIQEALTNVRKHAAARRVQVLFSFTATATHVIVADDGCGFQPPRGGDRGGGTLWATNDARTGKSRGRPGGNPFRAGARRLRSHSHPMPGHCVWWRRGDI